MGQHGFQPYRLPRMSESQSVARGAAFFERMNGRRSVRAFSHDPVAKQAIECAIRTASTAPSGAHRQPWTFVAVSEPELKREIREAVEIEERKSYEGRMPPEWLEAISPLGTDWRKPFLEDAPFLVVVFEHVTGFGTGGQPQKNYYVRESVGIACGLFIAALTEMGLCTVTHTPSPMGFLGQILGRPKNERAYMLFPVGYPAQDATVPTLKRKSLDQVLVWNPQVNKP